MCRGGFETTRTTDGKREGGSEAWAAPLDVVGDGDNFIVRASMPGVGPDNIQVSIEDNVLTIRGETASHFESAEGSYLMRERRSGSFHRSLRLPDTVDQDKAEPRYEYGVLTVRPAQGRGQAGQAVRGEGRGRPGCHSGQLGHKRGTARVNV